MVQLGPARTAPAENAIWQDGAVLVARADGSVAIWQVKFNTQSLHTGDDGLSL